MTQLKKKGRKKCGNFMKPFWNGVKNRREVSLQSRTAGRKQWTELKVLPGIPVKPRPADQQDSPAPSSTSNSPMSGDENARALEFARRTAALPSVRSSVRNKRGGPLKGGIHEEWRSHPCHGKAVRKGQAAQNTERLYQLKLAKLAAKRGRIENATASTVGSIYFLLRKREASGEHVSLLQKGSWKIWQECVGC